MPTLAQADPAAYPAKIVAPKPGDLAEVFSAIQGEGMRMGERQLFVRMGSCPFRCHYCDTPLALVPTAHAQIESPPTSRKFRKVKNPVSPEELREIVGGFLTPDRGVHRAIAITGGEPLWQAGFLKLALPRLREFGRRIYLETAGVHVEELKSILEFVDVIAMDVKPPSATGMKSFWHQHRDFLRASLAKEVMVKVVVTRKTTVHDLMQIQDLVSGVDRTVPVILQPATPMWKVKVPPTLAQLFNWQTLLSEKLERVRIIPQVHRALGDR
jgi:organic radical activating enzyme